MRLPEFNAEAALGGTTAHYRSGARARLATNLVRPASTCDADCLSTCLDNGPDCWELPRGANCGAMQKAYRQQCRRECCH